MKLLLKIFLTLFLLPSLVFAQNQGDDLSLGRGGTVIIGRVNETGTNLASGDNKANFIALTKSGKVLVVSGDPVSGIAQSVIPISNNTSLNGVGAPIIGMLKVGNFTAEALSTTTLINITGHTGRVGDYVITYSGAAANLNSWATIVSTTANSITVANPFPVAVTGNLTIFRPQPIGMTANNSGTAGSLLTSIDFNTQLSTATGILKLEDAAHANSDAGIPNFLVREDALTVSAGSTNEYINGKADSLGRQIVSYAPQGETWQGCGTATAVTSDVAIKASVASNRIYVTSITCKSTSATVATSLDFKDGSTVIAVGGIAQMATTSPGSFTVVFPVPLRGTSATALNFATNVATTSVTCCGAGYISVG